MELLNKFFGLICATTCIISVYGNGELTILHHPKSLVFKGHDHVKENILKEIYSSALGFTTQQHSNWNGLFIEEPFNLAEAVVTVAIDGVSNTGVSKGHHFPLKTNEGEFDVYSALERRVTERYPENENRLVRVNLEDALDEVSKYDFLAKVKHNKAKKLKTAHLKFDVDEDRAFLNDITMLNNIVDAIEKSDLGPDNIPDIYWFKIQSMHALRDLYGENSTQIKEANQLLNDAILRLNNVFNNVYKGGVLVTVVASDAIHTRRSRSILADEKEKDINLAKAYNKDYPVIFNIILWFGVAMVFALLAICIAIAEMDPGRDSIIYRMTSTRLKKDN